jgi:hypothetical protein
MKRSLLIPLAAACFGVSLAASPFTLPVSHFSDGIDGWRPDFPWTVEAGGGDPFLFLPVDGEGQGGKLITFTLQPEWTGNYTEKGVTGISLEIANWSDSDPIHLRIALGTRANPQQTGGTWLISNSAIFIPENTDWQTVFIPINEGAFEVVGNLTGEIGTETVGEVLQNVVNLRILSAAIPLGAIGDEFFGDVGMDAIALVPEPAGWSLFLGGLVLVGVLPLRRKRG